MNQKQIIEFLRTFKDNFQNVLTIFILTMCFSVYGIIIFGKYKDNPHIAEVRTVIGNVVIMIISYHFGSSRGSASKEKIIGTLTENNAEESKSKD